MCTYPTLEMCNKMRVSLNHKKPTNISPTKYIKLQNSTHRSAHKLCTLFWSHITSECCGYSLSTGFSRLEIGITWHIWLLHRVIATGCNVVVSDAVNAVDVTLLHWRHRVYVITTIVFKVTVANRRAVSLVAVPDAVCEVDYQTCQRTTQYAIGFEIYKHWLRTYMTLYSIWDFCR